MTTILETGYRQCAELTRAYGTTYYWSTYALPRIKRHHVHALYGFLGRPGGQAEHLARLGVEPRALEVHALLGLDREVALVRLLQLLGRHADEPRMDVHELGHRWSSVLSGSPGGALRAGT